jgi:hypothetical protein
MEQDVNQTKDQQPCYQDKAEQYQSRNNPASP